MTTDPNRSAVLQVVNSVPPVLAGYTDGLAQASNNKLVANDLISQAKEGVTLFDRAQDLVAARARTPVPSRTGGVFAGIPVMQDEFWKEVYGTGKPSERAEDPGLQEAPKFGDQIALGDSASRRGGPRLVAGAPQEEWETLQSKLEEILGQRAQVQPQSIDLSGVIQALRDRNVAMPKLPDLAKSRLTDSERVATILAGLLGGGATGVAQASNAAWAGAGQRAQRENAERERVFAQETALARQKMDSARNRFEVEKLLVENAERQDRNAVNARLAKLNLEELGIRSKIGKLEREGALRVEGLAALMARMAQDDDGWTKDDYEEIESEISEAARVYGLSPETIRKAIGGVPTVRDKKELDEVWTRAGGELAVVAKGARMPIDMKAIRGRFGVTEGEYLKGKASMPQVREEVSNWVSQLLSVQELISQGTEASLREALKTLGVAKVLGEHFSKLYSDRPEVVRGYAAERALLDQLVTQTLDAQAALRGVVKLNSSSKRRRGSRPKAVAFAGQKPPSDWVPGQIPPEDPGSSL